jgi:hypothetical protein
VRSTGVRYCSIGFAVDDLIVEGLFSTGTTNEVTQRDLWLAGAALDRKVRSLIAS